MKKSSYRTQIEWDHEKKNLEDRVTKLEIQLESEQKENEYLRMVVRKLNERRQTD